MAMIAEGIPIFADDGSTAIDPPVMKPFHA
jgi:hypothetical protein